MPAIRSIFPVRHEAVPCAGSRARADQPRGYVPYGRGSERRSVVDIRIKRAYAAPDPEDGRRILVDRLWPRGISKDRAKIDYWAKELAPSTELRKWYGHDRAKWDEFRSRYTAELKSRPEHLARLMEYVRSGRVTFVYSSTEPEINNAVALKIHLESSR